MFVSDRSANSSGGWRKQRVCRPLIEERRRSRKAARNQRTGLKFTISGPFLFAFVVGVGWRMIKFGPRLGILLGTL
jgi:hypothetical protein